MHQFFQITRLLLKLFQGLFISVTRYQRADSAKRHRIVRTWSSELLSIANVEVRAVGFPDVVGGLERPVTLVSNHVSWIDIFALNTQRACHFIAKSELREWPIAGLLLANVGTVFIDRNNRRETHRLGAVVHALMEAGETVAVFPEGTTSNGLDVRKFFPSLLEPVVAAGGEVWVVAIRYFLKDGTRTLAPAYDGDISFTDTLRAMRAVNPKGLKGGVVAELRFVEAIDCAGKHRREVTQAAEEGIRKWVSADLPA